MGDLQEEADAVNETRKSLMDLTKAGRQIFKTQLENEARTLSALRELRNRFYGHDTGNQETVTEVGTWIPEAGPLYQWASAILEYIRVIEDRYSYFAVFDDYYASREGKEGFDSCKVYVRRQIKELYVNRSGASFEFAGELFDKDDEEYNFRKLMEKMAENWETGIRYLTVVTNEDLPELNVFFKECLSGTDRYVNSYLIDRNALREACRKNDSANADLIYFRLLYRLHPAMEKICWKGRSYTPREYARQIIYKYIKVKNMFQFGARLKDPDKFLDGIDVRVWSSRHLLSELYYRGKDDKKGMGLAREMEDAIIDWCSTEKPGYQRYQRVIRASVMMYFYMGGEPVFTHTRNNGYKIHWESLEEAARYMENSISSPGRTKPGKEDSVDSQSRKKRANRNIISSIAIVAGILLLAGAGGLAIHNMREAVAAGESADQKNEVLNERIEANQRRKAEEKAFEEEHPEQTMQVDDRKIKGMPVEEIDGNHYIGKLEVPSLGTSLPVMYNWNYQQLKVAPCRYSGSYYDDDLVICGHNYRTHFSPLRALKPGDEVCFVTVEGEVIRYLVSNVETIKPTAVEEMVLNSNNSESASEWDLTLFTCTTGGRARWAIRCVRA